MPQQHMATQVLEDERPVLQQDKRQFDETQQRIRAEDQRKRDEEYQQALQEYEKAKKIEAALKFEEEKKKAIWYNIPPPNFDGYWETQKGGKKIWRQPDRQAVLKKYNQKWGKKIEHNKKMTEKFGGGILYHIAFFFSSSNFSAASIFFAFSYSCRAC